ncbi:hypothetical protein JXB28_05140 [Candidatus Woesearchaeota archaeon]|nr:hypothetical protein [Candidatus Woesearchaeota archaeon]
MAKIIISSLSALVMALIILPCVSRAYINEIRYNIPGNDNNKEYVEIKGTSNLSGYIIGDSEANDSLALLQFIPGNFSLIVEEGFNYSGISCSIYSAGPTIGNNLGNKADAIYLYYEGALVDSVDYTGELANDNGHSLELLEGQWIESCDLGGSPGKENCPEGKPTEEITAVETGLATSMVVYESDNMKIARKAPWLVTVPTMLVIAGVVFARKKER